MCSPAVSQEPSSDRPELAVILAAGEGRRLSLRRDGRPKPVLPLLGLSLVERTVTTCLATGLRRFLVVLGHRGDEVRAHLERVASRRRCRVEFVTAQDWKLGNGASTLAAAEKTGQVPFLLVMADHLIDPPLIEAVLRTPPAPGEICLAVDRNKAGLFDHEDATKVALSNGRVRRLGKSLERWDAADTGVFLSTRGLFDGLKQAAAHNRHTLSDGVNTLAANGCVKAVDVTGAEWLDVDTPEAYREARRRLLADLRKRREDGYVSSYLNRRVSTRLSAPLAGTPITPNQISVISFLVSLVGAGLLGLQPYGAWFVGGLLVQLASVLDGCDGEVARLKRLATPRGAWLDTILDRYSDLAVAIAVTFSYAASQGGTLPWLAGMFSAAGFILAGYVTKEFAFRQGRPYPHDLLNRLKRRDLRLLIISLGAMCGRPFPALLAAGALSHACVIGILIRGWLLTRPTAPGPYGKA